MTDIKIKDMSVEELVDVIVTKNGYSKIGIERIFELEFGILDKWITGEEDITCVSLTLLRILATCPWLVKVAEDGYSKCIGNSILQEALKVKNEKNCE